MDGIAATALKDPAHDVTAQHSPQSPNESCGVTSHGPEAPSAICHAHYDARGHCILLIDASGGILEQYDYDAFGQPYFYTAGGTRATTSMYGNRFLFTGREWLQDLRIYDFRNRQYQPELGRFLQPDPQEFAAGDYNLYRYCHNDPVNRSDPFGFEDIPISLQLDNLGIQASLNSLSASLGAKDGLDRSQLVQQQNGHLSLQQKFNVGVTKETKAFVHGRFQTKISQQETAKTDKGHTEKAVGHVHMDKTGEPHPHSPEFSGDDRAQARAGTPVYKVNESDPNRVDRLTPQTNQKDPLTIKTFRLPGKDND